MIGKHFSFIIILNLREKGPNVAPDLLHLQLARYTCNSYPSFHPSRLKLLTRSNLPSSSSTAAFFSLCHSTDRSLAGSHTQGIIIQAISTKKLTDPLNKTTHTCVYPAAQLFMWQQNIKINYGFVLSSAGCSASHLLTCTISHTMLILHERTIRLQHISLWRCCMPLWIKEPGHMYSPCICLGFSQCVSL